MCPYSNVLIYSLAACIFISCFQGAESDVPTISVTSDNPGFNCGINVVLECTIVTGPYNATHDRFWRGPPSNSLLTVGSKYIEDITNVASTNKYTLTVTDFSLSDGGDYRCRYGFDGTSVPVTRNYECYLPQSTTSPVSPVAACENGAITITVDKVFPNIPTTTLTVTVTDSSGTTVPGNVTSVENTAGPYADHFLLTWTSDSSTLADGVYTYTVGITTSSVGTEVSLTTGAVASVTCASPGKDDGLSGGAIAGIVIGCIVGCGIVVVVIIVGVYKKKKSKSGDPAQETNCLGRNCCITPSPICTGGGNSEAPILLKSKQRLPPIASAQTATKTDDASKQETNSAVSRRDVHLHKVDMTDDVAYRPRTLPVPPAKTGVEQTRGLSANFENSGTMVVVDDRPRKLPPIEQAREDGDGTEGQESDRSERKKKKKKKKKRRSDSDNEDKFGY